MSSVLIDERKLKGVDKDTEYEKCVCCGKKTAVLCSTHIDLRDNYIVGAGQLCRACYSELYNKTELEQHKNRIQYGELYSLNYYTEVKEKG